MQSKVFFAHSDGLRKAATAASLLASAMHFSPAHAQGVAVPEDAVEEQKRAGFWIEPRVSVGLALTNNSRLNADEQGEQVLSISPGFLAVFNSARIKGSVDYSLTGLYYAKDTYDDAIQHLLDGNLTVNVWGDRAFVDIAGKVDRVAISAFGPQSNDSTNPNLTESAQFRVSPYLKGYLGANTIYEARYSLQTTRTDVANRSDYTSNDWLIALGNRDTNQRMGWSLEARDQNFDYSPEGRKTESRSAEAGLSYAFTPVLRGSVFVGAETNDRVSLEKRSYSASGVGVDWRPSDRTRANIALDRRYYGNGHNVLLEHRTGRTVWRYTDIQSAMNNALEDVEVYGEHGVLGLSPRDFVTSSSTFERNQQLSAQVEGLRSVATFNLGRHKSRRLDTRVNLQNDIYDIASAVFQHFWNVVYAHRLTPLTTVSVSLAVLKTDSNSSELGGSSKSLAVGMTKRLGLRTSANIQLQRTVFSSTVEPYQATSISGFITHRF